MGVESGLAAYGNNDRDSRHRTAMPFPKAVQNGNEKGVSKLVGNEN